MNPRLSRFVAVVAPLVAGLIVGCDWETGASSKLVAEAGAAVLTDAIKGLGSRDAAVRARSAMTLGKMGPRAKEAVPPLTAALKDRDPSVRAAAAYTLGEIGPDARSAVKALESLQRKASLRDVAEKAIEKIGR